MREPPNAAPVPGRAERGSAYLFVLLALLVLTILGLSLVVITQAEVQIGGAEKSAGRVLFGADAGLRIQFAMQRNALAKDLVNLDTTNLGAIALTERIEMSVFYPTYSGPCSLCSVNWGEERYWAINYVVNSQARRMRPSECAEPPQAQKLLSAMYFIQPEKDRRIDESIRTYDSSLTAEDPCANGLEILRY